MFLFEGLKIYSFLFLCLTGVRGSIYILRGGVSSVAIGGTIYMDLNVEAFICSFLVGVLP